MIQLSSKKYFRISEQTGFTLLEAIVSLGLTSVIMSLLIGHVLTIHDGYHADMVRTQIDGNLRSGLDVMSMNIRQAGENLQSTFPALILENGTSGDPDVLKLRRNRISQVLALCEDASSGDTELPVSRNDLSVSQCVSSNVETSFNAFEALRVEDGGATRIFIFDLNTRTGEFLDYTAEDFVGSVYTLDTSALTNDYPALTTGIYVLEEYLFEVDPVNKTLTLEFEGDTTVQHTVAFDVDDLDITLLMDDGTRVDELLSNDATYDWKNLQLVEVTLAGSEQRKDQSFSSSVSGDYFPRNVLSFDG